MLADLRCDYEGSLSRNRPDTHILEEEAAADARVVLGRLAGLLPDERRIIYLKFYKGLPAREIADRLGMSSARRVYYMIDNALRKLRGNKSPDKSE